MTDKQNEAGVLAVLMQRLESQRLSQLLELKAKVDQGECLNDHDLRFLQDALTDAKNAHPLVANHPKLDALASKLVTLYVSTRPTHL